MSSFLGHALTGAGLALTTLPPQTPRPLRAAWTGWLMAVALAPDLDYVVPALNRTAHEGLRVTHSLGFALLLPALTLLALSFFRRPTQIIHPWGGPVLSAAFSHLALDLLVGVTRQPTFWPLTPLEIQLPFGLFPSAPLYALDNYYLYRNTFMELGSLGPLWVGVYGWRHWPRAKRWMCYGLFGVATVFAAWGASLAR